jgi:GntR family transcriptional regulator
MPSATAIADEFGIDRGTASRVLAELRHAGLIITKPRSGSYVRTFEPIQRSFPGRLGVWRTGEAIQDADTKKSPYSVEVTVGEAAATEPVALAFGIALGDPVVHRSRRFSTEQRPFQLADSYYLPELAHGTRIVYTDTGPGGVYARLSQRGAAAGADAAPR